eukprot:TRINITY_DN34248_c0_g1_i2.p1 TRINITY_DN34248_c0_g1~~TRINITY_DN34248_c0_g1_i2.p1  ORF type:complete len:439 (-),score=33.95 TRINITY_DN34248_c0_g1_i2:216-1460(-)
MSSRLQGGPHAAWIPLLTGTLHPRFEGLPQIQNTGWSLMGYGPQQPLEVYAALSTTPPRLRQARSLKRCLESILEQSTPLKAVLLALPRGPWRRGTSSASAGYPAFVPRWLRAMQKRRRGRQPQLRILRRVRDRGAGTGLLAAADYLRDKPKAWLLLVDDDVAYDRRLLETLLAFAAGTPGAAVSAQGWLAVPPGTEEVEEAGPLLERNLRSWPTVAGPILCGYLGVLLQSAMLSGIEPPAKASACKDHNDIWISAHLARQRIRRAFIAAPLQARALDTHVTARGDGLHFDVDSIGGASLTRRRRRRPEQECVLEFQARFGDELWRPKPRVVLCGARIQARLLDDMLPLSDASTGESATSLALTAQIRNTWIGLILYEHRLHFSLCESVLQTSPSCCCCCYCCYCCCCCLRLTT